MYALPLNHWVNGSNPLGGTKFQAISFSFRTSGKTCSIHSKRTYLDNTTLGDFCQEKGAKMHKIKEFRTLIGLKQLELAKIVGVSKQSISAYELGKKEPPLNILVRIAIALDSTPDELIEFRKVHDKLSQGILELIQKTKEPRN